MVDDTDRESPTAASDAADARMPDADTSDSEAPDADTNDSDERVDTRDGAGSTDADTREVVLPLRLYKTVTVFSTLIAIVCVVSGFLLLDAATLQASFVRQVVASLLGAVGLRPPESVLSAAFAIAGLLVIGFGAAVYVFGTRFRAPGMGGEDEE